MSKLSEIMFKEMMTKEVVIKGHKVVLRSLTAKDNMELDIKLNESTETGTRELTALALKLLSRSIVSVDDITPDGPEEIVAFLEKQETAIVFELLAEYQKMTSAQVEEIKN
jgi:phage FluMu protein gp41